MQAVLGEQRRLKRSFTLAAHPPPSQMFLKLILSPPAGRLPRETFLAARLKAESPPPGIPQHLAITVIRLYNLFVSLPEYISRDLGCFLYCCIPII